MGERNRLKGQIFGYRERHGARIDITVFYEVALNTLRSCLGLRRGERIGSKCAAADQHVRESAACSLYIDIHRKRNNTLLERKRQGIST